MNRSPAATTASLRAAMESRDAAGVVATFSPNATLHSPLTERLAFHGRDEIARLVPVLLDVLTDLHYVDEATTGSSTFLMARARIAGHSLHIVDHLEFDADGAIEKFTAFFRPLPVATIALQHIGAGLGRQRSRPLGALMAVATGPLVAMSSAGDRIGIRLVRRSLR